MRLEESDSVDYLSIDSAASTLVATILDDFDGKDEIMHIGLLQRKINRYLDAVESGEMRRLAAANSPELAASASRIRISIFARRPYSQEERRFLGYVSETVRATGVEFSFKVVAV